MLPAGGTTRAIAEQLPTAVAALCALWNTTSAFTTLGKWSLAIWA